MFIATLFGLALAMITLAGEVLYYRRKGKNTKPRKRKANSKNLSLNIVGVKPPKLDRESVDKFNVNKTVTIGSTFKPVNLKENLTKEMETVHISHISLYPKTRNRIPRVE